MKQTPHSCAIAVYESGAGAVEGVRALLRSDMDVNRMSVAGKDGTASQPALGFYTSGERTKYWGVQSNAWNALSAELCESSLFVTAELGTVIVMGPLVRCFVATLEGIQQTNGRGLTASALVRFGVPAESASRYESRVLSGQILLAVSSGPGLVDHPADILSVTHPVERAVYGAE